MAATVPASMQSLVSLRRRSEARAFYDLSGGLALLNSCRSVDSNLKGLMRARVLLRNRETGQFYAGSNGWSGNSSVAHDFDAVESATQFAKTERFAGLEVVVRDKFGHD